MNGTVTLDGARAAIRTATRSPTQWNQVRGVFVSLANPTSATPSFVPLFPGVYGFELTVSDGTTESAPAPVFIEREPADPAQPGGGGRDELRW